MFNFGAPPSSSYTSQPAGVSGGASGPLFNFNAPQQHNALPAGNALNFGAAQPASSNLFEARPMTNGGLPTIAQPVTGLPFPKETKFSDLPPELAANMESIEQSLRKAAEQSAALANLSFESTTKLVSQIGQFDERVIACEAANETCRGQLVAAKSLLNQYWRYGESVARMIISSRQTNPDGQVKWVPVMTPTDMSLIEDMLLRLESQSFELISVASVLKRQLDQLSLSNYYSGDILKTSLKHQHDAFMGLAGKVADLEEQMERLRMEYRQFIFKYRNDARDPFASRAGGARPTTTTTQPTIDAGPTKPMTTGLPPPPALTVSGGFNVPPPPPPSALSTSFNFGTSSLGGTTAKRASISTFQPATGAANPFLLQTPR